MSIRLERAHNIEGYSNSKIHHFQKLALPARVLVALNALSWAFSMKTNSRRQSDCSLGQIICVRVHEVEKNIYKLAD